MIAQVENFFKSEWLNRVRQRRVKSWSLNLTAFLYLRSQRKNQDQGISASHGKMNLRHRTGGKAARKDKK